MFTISKRFSLLGGVLLMAALLFTFSAKAPSAHAQASCGGTTDHTSANFDAAIPSTSNNSGNFDCIDGIGNSGAAVKQIQTSLNHCYGQNLTVDGIYGTLTSNAMKVAQKRLGITQDGVYGPQTRKAGFLFWGVTIQHPQLICGAAGF